MSSVKKRDLTEKVCPVRGRPCRWRKTWRDDWDPAVYRSRRCHSAAKSSG